jgi:thioester reductase-like protein
MEITISQFFANPTVEGLAKLVLEKGQVSVAESLSEVLLQDARNLPASITADKEGLVPFINPDGSTRPVRSLLLTGVTGFLGAFIAQEYLRNSSCVVYCLVRASSEAEASKRVVENLHRYRLLEGRNDAETAEWVSRIVPVVGDLGKPLFGLSQQRWNELAASVDAIVHNGALVNFGYPYVSLKAANVEGTLTVLKLATSVQLKPVHFVSTLSVIPMPHHRGQSGPKSRTKIPEVPLTEDPAGLEGGYTQSKWVSERLVDLAKQRGVPVTIFRPGRITGHSATGATNVDDVLNLRMKGCIQMGCAPDIDMPCDMTPVDFCSRAIVDITLKSTSWIEKTKPYIFHLNNLSSLPWQTVFSTVTRLTGHGELPYLPYPQWRSERLLTLTHDSHNALLPLVPMFGVDFEAHVAPVVEYQTEELNKILQSIRSPLCPPTTVPLVECYCRYFIDVGFLPTFNATSLASTPTGKGPNPKH